jgi:hypothetical protein
MSVRYPFAFTGKVVMYRSSARAKQGIANARGEERLGD